MLKETCYLPLIIRIPLVFIIIGVIWFYLDHDTLSLLHPAFWGTFFFCLILFFTIQMKMELTIEPKGLRLHITPFGRKWFFHWDHIERIERETRWSPISQFGGWGIRYNLIGRAYIFSGRTLLKITFKSERVLYLTTNHAQDIKSMCKVNHIPYETGPFQNVF